MACNWLGTRFGRNCDDGLVVAMGSQHTSPKAGCMLVTLFGLKCECCFRGSRTSPKSECRLFTHFGGYCVDGVNAGNWGPKGPPISYSSIEDGLKEVYMNYRPDADLDEGF